MPPEGAVWARGVAGVCPFIAALRPRPGQFGLNARGDGICHSGYRSVSAFPEMSSTESPAEAVAKKLSISSTIS
jgi:hypothetical protein